jgi:hypothetical protein
MTIQAGVGVSTNRNPKAAGKEAARKALDAAKLERPDFVFMFATVGYPQKEIVNAVRQATAQAPLFGEKSPLFYCYWFTSHKLSKSGLDSTNSTRSGKDYLLKSTRGQFGKAFSIAISNR